MGTMQVFALLCKALQSPVGRKMITQELKITTMVILLLLVQLLLQSMFSFQAIPKCSQLEMVLTNLGSAAEHPPPTLARAQNIASSINHTSQAPQQLITDLTQTLTRSSFGIMRVRFSAENSLWPQAALTHQTQAQAQALGAHQTTLPQLLELCLDLPLPLEQSLLQSLPSDLAKI